MRFKIVDKGPDSQVQYVAYVREWFIFPSWTMLGGQNSEEKAEALCRDYYNTKKPQTENVREFNIL